MFVENFNLENTNHLEKPQRCILKTSLKNSGYLILSRQQTLDKFARDNNNYKI